MSLPILIIGAGGHAAVVADALLAAGAQVLGFTDPDPARHGATLCGLRVLGDDAVLQGHSPQSVQLANGIGGIDAAGLRRAVQQRLEAAGWQFASVRHPSCVVSPFAHIGASSQLFAGCIVQAGARVGEGCIVNTAAVIEHDAVLGDFVHVAPGAVVCGGVQVGAASHVGAAAVIRQGVRLGERTLVGAGAAVAMDFEGGETLVGVPARAQGQQR